MAEREFYTGDPELDRIMAEFQANSQEFSGVMGEVDEVVGRAATPDDKIKVKVSVSGQLTGLHIDPRAMRMSSQELARTIVDLSHRAAEDAARHLMRVTRPYLEEDRGR
ncbi:YbaB/EbfC family nucleoid-associated protein [Nonomuraea sp. CA-218870]|uniref:YbaB/EbfC family nucleoid-associated protein n=1 Tax=Nonomuraea sp. CA-218870 TaxID=3239998 RepID=UPI003D8F8543